MLGIQALGLIAFLILIIGFWAESKYTIIMMHLMANFLYAIHYFLLGAISGGCVCTLVVISDFFLRNKTDEKALKRHGIIFSLIFLMTGLITGTSVLSLIPVIAAIFTMYLLSKEDANEVRLGMVFVALMWSAYGFIVKSYVVFVTELIFAISNVNAYNKYKKDR